jgi:hypothetical protein
MIFEKVIRYESPFFMRKLTEKHSIHLHLTNELTLNKNKSLILQA